MLFEHRHEHRHGQRTAAQHGFMELNTILCEFGASQDGELML